MRTNIWNFGLSVFTVFTAYSSSLYANSNFKVDSFEYLALGMGYETLAAQSPAAPCDAPADVPGLKDSSSVGLTATICPVANTFAMATFLNKKVASLVMDWVSWDASQLDGSNKELSKMPANLRKQYGIPAATVAYERQFGNPDADRFCQEKGKCLVHIWRSAEANRVASLVYAKINDAEVPLILHLSDVAAEHDIDRLRKKLNDSVQGH
ncbi:MAG: hypothetical protein H7318_02305 [Oligoflexus sp.]|nr:hypothetical protein [Oligoflexus sp.]